ncbi:MAG: SMP-30/gluconolactonase/LRE family protein [Bacteroidales bacterium]
MITLRNIFQNSLPLLPLVFFVTCSGGGNPGNKGNQTTSGQKTYPQTGSVERLDPGLDSILSPEARPEIIAEGFEWSEGPLWLPGQNMVIFSDIPNNSIFSWSEKDSLQLYLKPSGYTDTVPRGGETGSNGLLLDPAGRLVLCQHGDRRMARMNAPLDDPAPEFVTLVDSWQGKRLNSPNDAIYNSEGDLFFTDPAYGLEQRYRDPLRELDFTGVFRYDSDGKLTLLTDKLSAPNGIGLSPDESLLYVANSGGGDKSFWMVYEFAEDSSLTNGRVFLDASEAAKTDRGAPDGLEIRDDGIIFATGPGGVWIISPEGKHLGTIRTGQATSNCTLDGEGKYLYMTADMYLMRIALKP